MTPSQDIAARELLARVEHLEALCNHAPGVVPFGIGRAKKDVFAAGRKLSEAFAAPLKITPWTPYNPGNAK